MQAEVELLFHSYVIIMVTYLGGEVYMSKTMAELPYHYGAKLRIFPSTQQKRLIKFNSDASRFIYNEMNGMNRELYQLKQVKIPIDTVQQ